MEIKHYKVFGNVRMVSLNLQILKRLSSLLGLLKRGQFMLIFETHEKTAHFRAPGIAIVNEPKR